MASAEYAVIAKNRCRKEQINALHTYKRGCKLSRFTTNQLTHCGKHAKCSCNTFPHYPECYLQARQLIHHAGAIQLHISGFMSLTPKIRARKQRSVPIMPNHHVLLLWSTPGKHREGTDMWKMGYTPMPESTELAWGERTSDAESTHKTTFLVGTECQVCGRLKFQETAIIQQDKEERIQGTRLQLSWCIRSDDSITRKMAAASTVSLGEHRVTNFFPITHMRFHKCTPVKPEG